MIISQFVPLFCDPDFDKLVIYTNVPVDDQFSSPKQIRWGAALGKLLVCRDNLGNWCTRNFDLSFYSKFFIGDAFVGIDADSLNIYIASSSAVAYSIDKRSLTGISSILKTVKFQSPCMINASGDPDYVYVTSNNATDGHGLRQVKKSTMAVTATALATGSGDGQFDDPLGIFYYNSEIFVADYDNSRVSVWTKSGETLTYARKYDLGFKPMDLAFDGTNWYVQSVTNTYKYDNIFTDATKTSTACVGYSLTIIPDQGDGYGQTIAIVDSTNSHLERRKCSDLSAINSVGSAGDGSSSLFDPTFTTSVNTRVTYTFENGFSYTTPSGTSHAISWNGFAGYSWASQPPHKCVVTVAGGLELVTAIDCNTDAITSIKNLARLTNCLNYTMWNNAALLENLSKLNKKATTVYLWGDSLFTGQLSDMSPVVSYVSLTSTGIVGTLSQLPATVITLHLCPAHGITGTISDLPAGLQTAWLHTTSTLTAASIAHLTAIRDIRLYSLGWTQAGVDLVIDSIYQARMSYTYATPSLQIGGTNPNPSGTDPATDPLVTPGAGNSNVDWSWDAGLGYHLPLTGIAKLYWLNNDPIGEGFNKWTTVY